MKPNFNFRFTLAVAGILMGLLYMQRKENEHKRAAVKSTPKTGQEANKVSVSNTDYIFFESLSKYLFTSL